MLWMVLRALVEGGVGVFVRGVVCAEEQSRSKSLITAQPNTSQRQVSQEASVEAQAEEGGRAPDMKSNYLT